MPLVSRSEIEELEKQLERAARDGHTEDLSIIGYGEVTIAVKLGTSHGDFACKRLVPFSTAGAARRTAALIASYVEQLEACGIEVVETETPILESNRGHVLYCVQPLLRPGTLGPDFLRHKTGEEAAPYVRRIFEHIRASVTPSLAPDGQLSNWAIEDDHLRYLDVGTPFLRDERGRDLFDFTEQTRALPGPVRLIVNRFLLRGILDNYHSVRGQALDFLGNLIKEGLANLLPSLTPVANEVFDLDPQITEREVRAHYKSDAQTYAFVQAARRADRWVYRNLLRRPYPYLLPPRIDRFGQGS
ncbi:MAG: hypothetical protein AMJ62_04080 [Myxococcales bacterium SG8_38]|nr:MAG: hypothetical protein AMJ62_04080 [Myxococcales bacterium SG8_38]